MSWELRIEMQKEFARITEYFCKISQTLISEGIDNALITANCEHTTAGLLIQEFEKGLIKDFADCLNGIFPQKTYNHKCPRNNASSHLKVMIACKNQIIIPFVNRQLKIGKYQDIILYDPDIINGIQTRSIEICVFPCENTFQNMIKNS